MKEKLLMTLIGLIVMLILSWAVTAVASSYNSTVPVKATVATTEKNIDLHTQDADVEKSRSSHIHEGLPEARTNQ